MSNYEINVAKNGQHYFATHARSITTEDKARAMLAQFQHAFPCGDGFSISVSEKTEYGTDVTADMSARIHPQQAEIDSLIAIIYKHGWAIVAINDSEEIHKTPTRAEARDIVCSVDESAIGIIKRGHHADLSLMLGETVGETIYDYSYSAEIDDDTKSSLDALFDDYCTTWEGK